MGGVSRDPQSTSIQRGACLRGLGIQPSFFMISSSVPLPTFSIPLLKRYALASASVGESWRLLSRKSAISALLFSSFSFLLGLEASTGRTPPG